MEESREDMEKRIAQQVERQVEKGVTRGVTVGITILITVLVTFIVSVIVFKFVWGWVVPDLFPGAVAQGLISEDLTWGNAAKLAVLVAVLNGFYPSLAEAFKGR